MMFLWGVLAGVGATLLGAVIAFVAWSYATFGDKQ